MQENKKTPQDKATPKKQKEEKKDEIPKRTAPKEKALVPNDEDFLNYTPPSKEFVENISSPFYAYFTPKFLGLDNIDNTRPHFFVGYHTLLSITDILYITELFLRKDIMLRSLADSFHFQVPGWGQFWQRLGIVKASRENCTKG